MRKQIRNTLCILIGLMGFAAMPALAQVEMFLCIDGLKGESQSVRHKDCIDVLAWSWGASNSGSTHIGGGGGAGKANFQDISITKYIDTSSPDLLKHVADGRLLAKFELFIYKAGCVDCKDWPSHRLEAEDTIVTSVSSGGSGGESRLTENISLNFAKYTYCYTPADDAGKVLAGNEKCHAWDIAANLPR